MHEKVGDISICVNFYASFYAELLSKRVNFLSERNHYINYRPNIMCIIGFIQLQETKTKSKRINPSNEISISIRLAPIINKYYKKQKKSKKKNESITQIYLFSFSLLYESISTT